MKIDLKFVLLCCAAPFLLSSLASSQSVPAGVGTAPDVGFQLPQLSGSFNYALNASELISTGFYGTGAQYTTNFSGDATYLSRSTVHPFSAIYSGGYLLSNSGQPNSVYQGLSLSQSYLTRKWNFQIADSVSYLPESPVTGLSGIPGVGDIGIDPLPIAADSGIGILTDYGPRVSNTVTGSASRVIGARFSAQVSGYDSIQRFIGDNSSLALDNSSVGGSGGLSYHFDARSALTVNYNYSQFSYVGFPYSFTTQGATVDYSRQWSRRLSTDVYAGPQHISASSSAFGQPATELAAGGGVTYQGRLAVYTLNYSRGVNNGSGVIAGSFSDNVIGAASRQFGRKWSVSGTLSYSRTTSLPTFDVYNFSSSSVAVGVQAVRGFGRRFSGYGSYTVEEQSTGGTSTGLNAFSGTYQILGLGVSYSPGSLFLGR